MTNSSSSEHAARVTAMDAATTNASEVIEKLTLYMNRVRQASNHQGNHRNCHSGGR